MGREDEIRLIAYTLWEQEGCTDGYDCEHWYRAESIWEQQQDQKPAAKRSVRKSRTSVERKTKATVERKRSKKAS